MALSFCSGGVASTTHTWTTFSGRGAHDVSDKKLSELYKQISIDPSRGVLLYGPPGTGKLCFPRLFIAIFIRLVGSEFVHKYLDESPRMVRDVFCLATERDALAIIFIDEVDAIPTARFDHQTGADREVQRILTELLS